MFNTTNMATYDKIFLQLRNEEKDDPQQFIEDLLEVGRLNELGEGKLILMFKMSLGEEAKDWMVAQPLGLSFEEILKSFGMIFVSNIALKASTDKLSTLKFAGGSILNYLDRMARKGIVPEDVLIALVLKKLPCNLANIVLVNNKDGLSWEYLYRALRNVKTVEEPRYMEVSSGAPMEIDAVRKKSWQQKGFKKENNRKIECFICGQ
ncbi:pol polyprotein [Vairimorpha ceranae]|uniref:Pol polyprotein n=1 Tax=Vairimorpha ceranae TaxID=40302 RepID=A0A0F9YN79_9MICR|nr:pol polyprotein [Vairimorpha ceranae]KKO74167.1 pol polyprotein [Vairimorpha ceranae]